MKIVYDHQIFIRQRFGGISRYYSEIAPRIAQQDGMEVRLFALGRLCDYLECERTEKLLVGFKQPYLPLVSRSARPLYQSLNVLAGGAWMKGYAPDIVHETYFSPGRMAPPRTKVVLTVFDLIYEKFGEMLWNTRKTRAALTRAVQRADHIICISENTRKDLLEHYPIPAEKVSVVHLGFSGFPSETNSRNGHRPTEKPYILWVGKRHAYKNFERALRAYAASFRLKRDFMLVCGGGGAFTPRERQWMRELDLTEREIVQMSVDDSRLASLYRHAACLLYPSLYEGFGIPLLEAMAFGCPVVCSNTSSLPEVAAAAAEFFDPTQEEDIRRALEQSLYSEERRAELIRCGTERVRQFSWEKCAQETADIYRSVIGR